MAVQTQTFPVRIPARRGPLQVRPPAGDIDPAARAALTKLAERQEFQKAAKAVDALVRDYGLTVDMERLRDRVERRFRGLELHLLAQNGVLQKLLMDAMQADAIRVDDTKREEEEAARDKRTEDQHKHMLDAQAGAERRAEARERAEERRHTELVEHLKHLAEVSLEQCKQNGELLKSLVSPKESARPSRSVPARGTKTEKAAPASSRAGRVQGDGRGRDKTAGTS